jgi:P27 family predicted phage terminase small subunit
MVREKRSRMATPTGRPNGRPPKPTEIKRALGNPGHRPLPEAPSVGEGLEAANGIPQAPVLGKDGLELWNHVWTAGKKWLSPTSDLSIIVMLCQAQDEAEQIRRALAVGEIRRYYVLPNGQQVSHPLVNQLKDLRSQITAWLSALGFSPTDRARLGLAEIRQVDVLDELERRRVERKKIAN